MLTEFYIKALLVDEKLADQVWQAWDEGEIDDLTAFMTWSFGWSLDVVPGLKVFYYDGSGSLADCSGYSTAPNHRWTPITPVFIWLLKFHNAAELAVFVVLVHRLKRGGHNALKFGTINDGSSHSNPPYTY